MLPRILYVTGLVVRQGYSWEEVETLGGGWGLIGSWVSEVCPPEGCWYPGSFLFLSNSHSHVVSTLAAPHTLQHEVLPFTDPEKTD